MEGSRLVRWRSVPVIVGIVVGVVALLVSPGSGPARLVRAQAIQEYLLGPGDSLEIAVFGEPDLTRSIPIRPDGRITFPLIGDVVAAGLTPTQLTDRLTGLLKLYLRNPQVSVSVRTFQRAHVYLLGEFTRPGAVEIQNGWTLIEVLASVGSVTPRAALTQAVLIRRGTGQTISLNLDRLLHRGDRSVNVSLEPGDIVMVPVMRNRVLVLGSVRGVGAYDMEDGSRILDAIIRAGGPADRVTANNIGIIRTGADGKATVVEVDMTKIVKGDLSQNVPVRNGDIIFVPEGPRVRWSNVLAYLAGLGFVRSFLGL